MIGNYNDDSDTEFSGVKQGHMDRIVVVMFPTGVGINMDTVQFVTEPASVKINIK